MTGMADWQQGIELDRLKAFAAPFKARHKALVFGAFGLTKERDVAEALAKNRAIWTGNPPTAVALFNQSKVASEQHDFAQRPYMVPAGGVVIKAAAALDPQSGLKVLATLIERAQGAPVFAEIFEEDAITKQAALAAGLAYCTTKVSAGSEIKGVYCTNCAPPLGPLDNAEAATLIQLDRDFLAVDEHAAITAELAKAHELFAQHYSDYNKRKSWTAFALHGYSDDPTFIIKPAEMSKSWKEENPNLLKATVRDTKVAPAFPATMRAVKRLGLRLDRVRFMRLRSRDGELSRHADITDREAGVADGMVTRLHVPIRTSPAVTFFGWTARGERLACRFPERSIFYLDQRKPHAVTNTDPALDRVHLVIDCHADARLRQAIGAAAAATRQVAHAA